MFVVNRRSNFTKRAIEQSIQMEKCLVTKPEFAEHFPFGQGSVYITLFKSAYHNGVYNKQTVEEVRYS